MNRNAKIALGCGGAGCIGLIVVVIIVVVLIVTGIIPAPGLYDANRNSNNNYNRNSNDNSNANTNANGNESTSSSDSSDSSSLSDDDKHKLFQAAGMTQDSALIMRVLKKIGFSDVGGEEYQQFVKDHGPWALRNMDFVRSVVKPEKAREYVEAHIDD